MYWLAQGQNAAAVQAVCAIAVAILTGFLVWATLKYVVLTQNIARTIARQLAASIQPILDLKLMDYRFIASAHAPMSIRGDFALKNRGSNALKVCSVTIVVRFKNPDGSFEQIPYPITDADNLVLMPDQEQPYKFLLPTGRPSAPGIDCELSLGPDCTDLAGVSEHSFYRDYSANCGIFLDSADRQTVGDLDGYRSRTGLGIDYAGA